MCFRHGNIFFSLLHFQLAYLRSTKRVILKMLNSLVTHNESVWLKTDGFYGIMFGRSFKIALNRRFVAANHDGWKLSRFVVNFNMNLTPLWYLYRIVLLHPVVNFVFSSVEELLTHLMSSVYVLAMSCAGVLERSQGDIYSNVSVNSTYDSES